jgi:phosphatidylglycerol---prolipoprotein diacylglyceryl transferase
MLPYLDLPTLSVGPFTVASFGILSALGVVVGARLALDAARRDPGDARPLSEALPWMILGGLVGAHLMHVLAYHPATLAEAGPIVLLRIWDGLSSMGGVLGALAALVIHFRLTGRRIMPYLDAIALGAAPGWAIARIGCFTVHDHPGRLTDFPLAVAFPGGARHDLGLYEALLLASLAVVLLVVRRRVGAPRPGLLMGLLAVGYAVPRFFLDFLRATDLPGADGRYFGLTPAQYVTLGLLALGLWLLLRGRRSAVTRDVPGPVTGLEPGRT